MSRGFVRGTISTVNSTTTPLSGSATYTGTWEIVKDFASISIIGTADVAGTLWADFSTDGSTESRNILLSDGKDGAFGIHSLIPVAQYFRVRVINGAGAQASMDVQTVYHDNPRIALPTTRLGQSIGIFSDVLNIRQGNDVKLDTATGLIAGRSVIHKFGENPVVAVSSTEDVTQSGVINWLTAATTVRIKAGGNAADDTAGAGSQSIIVAGLDENFEDAEETIVTAGASASSVTTTTFIRVFRAWGLDAGAYTGANTGDIVIENGAGGTDLLTITAGMGQSETSEYTIPAGKTGYLTRISAEVDANKACDMHMWQRRDADNVSAPYTGKRIVADFPQLIGSDGENFESYIEFPEKTDLWWTATTGAGNPASVGVDYDLILVDN